MEGREKDKRKRFKNDGEHGKGGKTRNAAGKERKEGTVMEV